MIHGSVGKSLATIVKCKVLWNKNMLDWYSVDASSYTIRPLAVAIPRNIEDVVAILRFAAANNVSIIPRGAGTGLVGGALGKGIVLDMRHFDKIRIRENFVEVGSGVFKGRLDKELKKHGRFLGPNPSIGPFCTLGGMIATNASGSHSLKYGSIIDSLIEITIVTSQGKVLTFPNNNDISKKIFSLLQQGVHANFPAVSKNSCGYRIDKISSPADIGKIIAGSEGTLGIIVSAKLKTFHIPLKTGLLIIGYSSLREAVNEIPNILRYKPSALEMIDNSIAKFVREKIPTKARVLLFVEFDQVVKQNMRRIKQITGGSIVREIFKHEQISQWWRLRNSALVLGQRSISRKETMPTLIEDATVPVYRLSLLLDLIENLERKYNIKTIVYGHAGNGNLHIRPILRKRNKMIIKKIAKEFFTAVIGIGGSITGEHGDGLARSEFVKLQYGSEVYCIFEKIKHYFDPKNILNPGKIVSSQSTITKNLRI